MSKVVGSWGVFAVRNATGASLGSPNGDAPSNSAPPLLPASAHNAEVRSYFVAAGVAEGQILDVQEMASMLSTTDETNTPVSNTLQRYYSYVTRHYHDIPVVDSFAWAALSDDGSSVHESVYWPQISSATLDDADAFAENLDNPEWKASFESALPVTGGRLVIHHTGIMYNGSFQARATYDVKMGMSMMHFDQSAQPVTLADEAEDVYGPTDGS